MCYYISNVTGNIEKLLHVYIYIYNLVVVLGISSDLYFILFSKVRVSGQ